MLQQRELLLLNLSWSQNSAFHLTWRLVALHHQRSCPHHSYWCIKNVEPYHCSITQDRKEASIHHKLKSVFGRWESHSLINYHKLNLMLHLFVCINDGFVAQTCLNLFLNLSNKCSRGLFIELKFYHPTALHSPKQHQQILYIIKFSIKRAWICINNHNYCPNQTTIFTTIS